MVYNTGCTIANDCGGSWASLWFALGLWGFVALAALVLWMVFRERTRK